MPPTLAHGKICYVEIPAIDLNRSVAFYRTVFGWSVRQRGDGSLAFDDGVGEVSGTWILGRPPSSQPGLLLYIMVDSVAATLESVVANGGEVTQPIGADAPEVTARFRDPAGNVIGLYQEPTKSARGEPSVAD
ncbi:MAG TPA: VOC family protein [Candidatus Binatia bacterium]